MLLIMSQKYQLGFVSIWKTTIIDQIATTDVLGPTVGPTAGVPPILSALPIIGIPRLCKDFCNLGRVPYLHTDSFVEMRPWIRVCDNNFCDLGLDGNVRW